jgi:hypothetical protein
MVRSSVVIGAAFSSRRAARLLDLNGGIHLDAAGPGRCHGESGHVLRVTGDTSAGLHKPGAGALRDSDTGFDGRRNVARGRWRRRFRGQLFGRQTQGAHHLGVAILARPVQNRLALFGDDFRIGAILQ